MKDNALINCDLAMNTDRNSQERELIRQIGQGDHSAFRVIFDRYRSDIYRFCFLMLGDKEATNDVYQETFLAFYEACSKGTIPDNVRNYILRAVRNRALNYIKVNSRYERGNDFSDLPSSPYNSDHEVYEFQDHLQSALEQIPSQYREAFLMAELVGYNYDEIGKMLEINHHTVKNRIYRARLALRKILSLQMHETDGGKE